MHKLTRPVSEPEAYYDVHASATIYPTSIRIYIPKSAYPKIKDGFELSTGPVEPYEKNSMYETDEERSIRRTRKKIKDYTLCNEFDLFATWTIATDRNDIEKSKNKISNWLKSQKKKHGSFEYLVVPEFHKDRSALHFHGLIRNFTGNIEQATNPYTNKPLKKKGKQVYQFSGYKSGFSNVVDVRGQTNTLLSYYLQKYITKDMPLIFGKNRYYASRGLKIPVVIDNPEHWYYAIKPDNQYENDYGTFLEFDRSKHGLLKLLYGDIS